MIDLGDHRVLVRPSDDDPLRVYEIDQFVIHDAAGKEHHVRLFPNMNPDKLKQDILKEIAPPPIPRIWLHCAETHGEEYESILKKMFPKSQYLRLPDTPAGEQVVDGQIGLTVNEHYWRSIAKIGFHYFLSHTSRGVRGDEPGFAAIRNFIINGGDKSQFFDKPKNRFGLPFGELSGGGIMVPTQWCHVVAADETNREVVAYVQLFIGPGYLPEPHYLLLGNLDSNIVGLSSFIHGHVYLYDDHQKPSGKAGRVEPLTVTMYPMNRAPKSCFVY